MGGGPLVYWWDEGFFFVCWEEMRKEGGREGEGGGRSMAVWEEWEGGCSISGVEAFYSMRRVEYYRTMRTEESGLQYVYSTLSLACATSTLPYPLNPIQ